MKLTLVVAAAFALAMPLVSRAQMSPWTPPEPPRSDLQGRMIRPASERCQPGHYEAPYAEYLATGSEIEAIPFEDRVFGRFPGLRLVIDLSASPITLPRGVWWIGIQPVPVGEVWDPFFQVIEKQYQAGELPMVYYTGHYFGWLSLHDFLGDAAGDAGMKVVSIDGRALLDSSHMVDQYRYTNGFYNSAQRGWEDVRLVDDFFVPRRLTVTEVVGDYLTYRGVPPEGGVWVRFYPNVFCPQLNLEGPTPGRAGERNMLRVSQARPGDGIHFFCGLSPGEFPIPGCSGAAIDIANPIYLGRATADADGQALLSFFVPEKARGRTIYFQALQHTTCLRTRLAGLTFQ